MNELQGENFFDQVKSEATAFSATLDVLSGEKPARVLFLSGRFADLT